MREPRGEHFAARNWGVRGDWQRGGDGSLSSCCKNSRYNVGNRCSRVCHEVGIRGVVCVCVFRGEPAVTTCEPFCGF